MFGFRNLHRDESGQTALEAAIILIAFIVVASVFAFAVLSAGSESTERGQEAIYAGLEDVQSSLSVKGAVIAQDTTASQTVDTVVFTVAKVSGGEPVDMTDTSGDNTIVIGYRDEAQFVNEIDWAVSWIGDNDGDALLEEGELAEVSVDLSALTTPLAGNTQFTIEIKPPTGAVFQLKRTTPAAIEAVMELR
jgi:flagellin FlaB